MNNKSRMLNPTAIVQAAGEVLDHLELKIDALIQVD